MKALDALSVYKFSCSTNTVDNQASHLFSLLISTWVVQQKPTTPDFPSASSRLLYTHISNSAEFERYATSLNGMRHLTLIPTVVDREGFHILAIWYASAFLAVVLVLNMDIFESLGIVDGRISHWPATPNICYGYAAILLCRIHCPQLVLHDQ